jgi:hypothetical protein
VLVERLSRAQFVRRGALAAGGAATLGLVDPLAALGRSAGSPSPIPGGLKFLDEFPFIEPVASDPDIHILGPTIGSEASSITDLNGVIAAAEIQGGAHGSDGTVYDFDADMRFMQGWYADTDGKLKKGTFGFI